MSENTCIRVYANIKQIKNCKKVIEQNEKLFSQLTDTLALAGNEVRLKIIYLLDKEDKLCPCDLADILGMSAPAISQHLRKMKDGNIIISERKGQTIYYSLSQQHRNVLKPLLKQLIKNSLVVI